MWLAYLLFCLLFSSFHECFSITCMLETILTAIPVNGGCMYKHIINVRGGLGDGSVGKSGCCASMKTRVRVPSTHEIKLAQLHVHKNLCILCVSKGMWGQGYSWSLLVNEGPWIKRIRQDDGASHLTSSFGLHILLHGNTYFHTHMCTHWHIYIPCKYITQNLNFIKVKTKQRAVASINSIEKQLNSCL